MPADLRLIEGGVTAPEPQVHGENLRTQWVQDGAVHVQIESPDGSRVVSILTPRQARDMADELLDLAEEAEGG
jgi:hypothetical protein